MDCPGPLQAEINTVLVINTADWDLYLFLPSSPLRSSLLLLKRICSWATTRLFHMRKLLFDFPELGNFGTKAGPEQLCQEKRFLKQDTPVELAHRAILFAAKTVSQRQNFMQPLSAYLKVAAINRIHHCQAWKSSRKAEYFWSVLTYQWFSARVTINAHSKIQGTQCELQKQNCLSVVIRESGPREKHGNYEDAVNCLPNTAYSIDQETTKDQDRKLHWKRICLM